MFDSIRRAKREKENSGKILQQERHEKDKNGTLFLWAARSRIFLPSAAPQQWPTAAMMNLSSAPEQAPAGASHLGASANEVGLGGADALSGFALACR
jgi:hypothetical protein